MNEPKNISTEQRRTYTWPDGVKVVVESPVQLVTSDNGHRIVDASGNGHYIPKGWVHLFWENKPGAKPLVA